MTILDAIGAVQKPSATRDFAFFYEGLNNGVLLVQKCASCGQRRHPAGPMCPVCRSLDWTTEALPTTGTIYSYIVHRVPPYPDYPSPHIVALVEMAPDIRVLGALVGCTPEVVSISMKVRTEFVKHADNFSLHRFRPMDAA